MKMDIQEIAWKSLDWIYLVQDRDKWWALLNIPMHLWVLQCSGNFLANCWTVSFWRRRTFCGVSFSVAWLVVWLGWVA